MDGETLQLVTEPDDAARRDLLDRYCAAFEAGDVAALTDLLQTDIRLEMPPMPVWFTGRDAVMRFLATRALAQVGDVAMVPTSANGQPAVAEYRRTEDGVLRAHSIHVITAGTGGIEAIIVFLDPETVHRVRHASDPLGVFRYPATTLAGCAINTQSAIDAVSPDWPTRDSPDELAD
jgi:ketosteroid isomerase-like protein